MIFLIFLLPFNAFLITYLKCGIWINVDILRFWKEIVVIFLLFLVLYEVFIKNKLNFKEVFYKNYLLISVIFYSLLSLVYLFYPKDMSLSWILWIKYDLFFLFCLIIWVYLSFFRDKIETIIKTLFVSSIIIIWVFLSVYMFGDIKSFYWSFWYWLEPSSYSANSCISYSQNVTWWINRFQWSFWDPIRLGVFFVMVYFLSLGLFLDKFKTKKNIFIFSIYSLFLFLGIYFSYTKTTLLWFISWVLWFVFLVLKTKFDLKISKKIIFWILVLFISFLSLFLYIKRDYLLHPWSVWERTQNLIITYEMLVKNPFWYGMWVAWPSSQLWTSNDADLSSWVKKFLPENWYLQVFLEVWIVWFGLCMFIIWYIIFRLYNIVLQKKDYLSIGIFISFITIVFMWNLTHIFEERATSYILFLIVWIYIVKNRSVK